jgi:mono/diheme cytochrome c family protein
MSNKKKNSRRPSAATRRSSRLPRRLWWALGGVAALVVVIAIAASEGNRAPADAIVPRDPAAVAAGAEIYVANCATCHGVDLNGTETGPPFLNVIYAPNHHADEAFQRAVVGGVQAHHWGFGPMAPVPGLTRDDVALIIEYVRSVQEAEGIIRDPSHG